MKQFKLAVGVLGASMLLNACGGDDNDTPETTETPVVTEKSTGLSCSDATTFPAFITSCTAGTPNQWVVNGTIAEDFIFTAADTWVLGGTVQVGAGNVTIADNAQAQTIKDTGATLTIEAGTNILSTASGQLIVTRGSKLMADGTAAAPITFSSSDANFDGQGEWGGIVIQGFAPQYGAGNTGACYAEGNIFCNVAGEGGTEVANYGGSDMADNSGIIRYVRIAEGGKVAGPNNEINGLTLQGVGHGTTVEYVHVHGNLDDGIEWFGGTVNVKYVVLTNNDDDDIDFDEGYKGNIQYAIVVKDQVKTEPTGSNDPRGIEANSSDDEYAPQTSAVLANVTIIGGPVNNNAAHSKGQQPGMRLRGAVSVAIHNSAVNGFDTGCIRIDDADVAGDGTNVVPSATTLNNVIGSCTAGLYQKRASNMPLGVTGELAFNLDTAFALTQGEATFAEASTITALDNGSGFIFDQTDFIGAVKPTTAAADAWWAGWIIPGALDSAITNNASL